MKASPVTVSTLQRDTLPKRKSVKNSKKRDFPIKRRNNIGYEFKESLEKYNKIWNSPNPSSIAIQRAIAEVFAPDIETDSEYYDYYSSMDNVLGIILGGVSFISSDEKQIKARGPIGWEL